MRRKRVRFICIRNTRVDVAAGLLHRKVCSVSLLRTYNAVYMYTPLLVELLHSQFSFLAPTRPCALSTLSHSSFWNQLVPHAAACGALRRVLSSGSPDDEEYVLVPLVSFCVYTFIRVMAETTSSATNIGLHCTCSMTLLPIDTVQPGHFEGDATSTSNCVRYWGVGWDGGWGGM